MVFEIELFSAVLVAKFSMLICSKSNLSTTQEHWTKLTIVRNYSSP